jgi:hypothetical protein
MSKAPGERVLSPRAFELLQASDEERLFHIKKPVFIAHSRVKAILAAMEQLLTHPRTNRMPNLLIVGRSNSGKTEIQREFLRRHPPQERLEAEAIHAPVLFVQCPPGPDDDMLITQALKTLRIQARYSAKVGDKIDQLADALVKVGTRVLLLDELNSLLAGSVTRQRLVLNTLKYLSNDVGISIVASGTKDALQAVASDDQQESRFPPMLLPRWPSANLDFRQLLASFESVLPLRNASHLSGIAMANLVYGLTDGVIGDVAHILREGAAIAIRDQSEAISEAGIKAAAVIKRPSRDELALL